MTTEDEIKVVLDTLQLALEREQQLWVNPPNLEDARLYAAVYESLDAVRNAISEVLGEPELQLPPEE